MFATRKLSYSSLLEYLPIRFGGTEAQVKEREEVFNFKGGRASQRTKDLLVSKINDITRDDKANWVICFIPSSTRQKTETRYRELSGYLMRQTGVATSMLAITNLEDRESQHTGHRLADPTVAFAFDVKEFSGKKVLLINDVITNGTTFRISAHKMLRLGAVYVQGLFVAQTVHPGLPQYTRNKLCESAVENIFRFLI